MGIKDKNDDDSVIQTEFPYELLPDLGDLGIEEVERGVCYDTAENRRAIRGAHYTFRDVFRSNGEPTDLIQVITPEMKTARAEMASSRKRDILVSRNDMNSDYKTGLDLILETDVDTLIPAWVISATRHWQSVEREREREGGNPRYRPGLMGPPGRCIALKGDGLRCMNWYNGTTSDGQMCRMHLGRHGVGTVNTVAKARNRIESAAAMAVENLERLAADATSEQVKLKANTEILDRAGIRAGIEIDHSGEVEVVPAGELLRNRLKKLLPTPAAPEESDLPELEATVVSEDEK